MHCCIKSFVIIFAIEDHHSISSSSLWLFGCCCPSTTTVIAPLLLASPQAPTLHKWCLSTPQLRPYFGQYIFTYLSESKSIIRFCGLSAKLSAAARRRMWKRRRSGIGFNADIKFRLPFKEHSIRATIWVLPFQPTTEDGLGRECKVQMEPWQDARVFNILSDGQFEFVQERACIRCFK